jgi:uncharacterized membrane protein YphA (DoxX/SURF4 family)
MTNPLKTEASFNLGLLLGRLPMGAFFLLAGVSKLQMGVGRFVSFAASSGHAPPVVPPQWFDTYLHAVPFLELTVGVFLILGLLGRVGGLIGALMVLTFTVGFTGLYGNPPDHGIPFHPNFIYMGLLLVIFLLGPGRISVDSILFGRGPAGK